MTSENAREQLLLGYKKASEGLNAGRLEDWVELETEAESIGALAAIALYGACVRESMSRGLDSPLHAHNFALLALEFYEEDQFDSVLNYLAGNPSPSQLGDMVEYYKKNIKSKMDDALKMVDFEIHFENGEDNLDLDED